MLSYFTQNGRLTYEDGRPTLIFALVVVLSLVRDTQTALCAASGDVTVASGTTCTLDPGQYNYGTLTIDGTVITETDSATGHVHITADTVALNANGKILVGEGHAAGQGAGAGNSDGSGGE